MSTTSVIQLASSPSKVAEINERARRCESEFFLLVGQSVEWSENALSALEDFATRQSALAAVCGRLVYPRENTILAIGMVFGEDGLPYRLYRGFPADHPAVERSRMLKAIAFEFTLVRREAFLEFNGLDAGFAEPHASADWCLRAAERSWGVHYCHAAVAYAARSLDVPLEGSEKRSRDAFQARWGGRIRSDEFDHYQDDGLIRWAQHMMYPLELEMESPLHGAEMCAGGASAADMLRAQSRRMLEMVKENIRLKQACLQLENAAQAHK